MFTTALCPLTLSPRRQGTPTRSEFGQRVIIEHVVVDYIATVGPISLTFCTVYLLFATFVPPLLEKTCMLLTSRRQSAGKQSAVSSRTAVPK